MADAVIRPREEIAPSSGAALGGSVFVVRGRDAVVGMKALLVELGRRCDQREGMVDLEYFLDRPKFNSKRPCLVLVSRLEDERMPVSADEVLGAVLLYEYQLLGLGSRVFVADYHGGDRTVVAPAELRRQVAFKVCAALLKRGALLVQLSVAEEFAEAQEPELGWGSAAEVKARWRWAAKTRRMPGYLRLEETLDGTLSLLGKHTRRNLRQYRRRAEADLDYEFVSVARLSEEEFLALNRECLYPAADDLAKWRYEVLRGLPNGVLMGLRTKGGEWLSMVGGRLHEGSITIEWQMNRQDLPSNSLSTVMRSHLIEHAVGERMTRLYFVGGTTHTMKHSLVDKQTVDLVGMQFELPAPLVSWLAQPVVLERNFVVQHLSDEKLNWRLW